jgi:hypothetical protein
LPPVVEKLVIGAIFIMLLFLDLFPISPKKGVTFTLLIECGLYRSNG